MVGKSREWKMKRKLTRSDKYCEKIVDVVKIDLPKIDGFLGESLKPIVLVEESRNTDR
jgi:hypothetical protein